MCDRPAACACSVPECVKQVKARIKCTDVEVAANSICLLDALVALARLHQATSWMRWVRRPALGDGVVGSVLSIACVEILLAGAAHDHRLVA